MRRYRKGQTFRPPTAAESAAHADAIEAHRRRPPQPQDRRPIGQDIIVKTPSAGIAARCGTTIYSATCTRCIPIGDAEEMTITETDEELIVFNLYPDAVTGSAYVITSLEHTGIRFVSGEPC
jgi:hypothetical protein